MPDRLVVDLGDDGLAGVLAWPDGGGMPEPVSQVPLAWPLDSGALEDLRWYLEDYLLSPYGVWESRGPAVRERLAGWGDAVFGSVFGPGPARDEYQRARDRGLEVVFRSNVPGLLALPWELMRDGAGPVALGAGGVSRSLPAVGGARMLEVPGGQLRVLMVISRPDGTRDVGYQMVARPLLERLAAVRGEVALTVLRPPTFGALSEAVRQAADAGQPFHVVHFDGHGAMLPRPVGGAAGGRPATMSGPGEGVLAFEQPGGGSDLVAASKVASVMAGGKVPVVVLNACQSGAVGKELEASVATALLRAGCAAVVAMAYSVYAVAAAEFMAAFYESLFAGDSVGQAVAAGRGRLFEQDRRPSPKGDMPLADWLVPVHYMRTEVRFPQAKTARPAAAPPLDEMLDQIRAAPSATAAEDPLAAAAGVFVGRDDLFYQMEAAARSQRVVLLTGSGGTGKTELAKGFARWWQDTDGVDDQRLVCWHSFEPGVASFGLDGVLTGIGLRAFGADFALLDSGQRLDAVKRLLGEYRGLLVWDNFESVREMPDPGGATPPLDEAGCAQLREFLDWVRAHSKSTVLITSRAGEAWLGQVHRIGVGGLDRAEATQYAGCLLDPFPAAQQRRERRSFGELLEWLDGHPLAMRLTLPRLDTTDPAELLAELRSTTPLPAPRSAEDAGNGRLSSLAACITYSFTHLTEQTRRLLPAVSLLHGIADVNLLVAFSAMDDVPARFAGIGRAEWTLALEDAARVGLLTELAPGIYNVHPALPGFLAAGWQADSAGRYNEEREACDPALTSACAAFSAWLTKQVQSGDAAFAYRVIGQQRRIFGAALAYAIDHHAWADADSIVRSLDYYWTARGLTAEADTWADLILTVISQASDESARALWLFTITQRAARQMIAGRPEQAERTYQEALVYLQNQPATGWTRTSTAVAYHQLGMIAQRRMRLDDAEDWYRRSLAIKEELGDRSALIGTYHHLGIVAHMRGRLEEAEDWCRQSLAISEELGDRPKMAKTFNLLGIITEDLGRLDEAKDWCLRSLAIFEEFGDRPNAAPIYHQLGIIAYLRRRLDEAEEWFLRSLAIFEELGNRPDTASSYHQLGMLAQNRGRLDEAGDWYRRSLAIHEELGNRPSMASSYHQLGVIAYLRGRLDEAEDWSRRSLAIDEELGNRPGMANAYHELGMLAQGRGRLDEAGDWYRRSLAITEETGNRRGMALTYAQLSLLAEERYQSAVALEWVIRSVALFTEFPSPQTGTAPSALARLTRQLGLPALEQAWQRVTGQPVPPQLRDYLTSEARLR